MPRVSLIVYDVVEEANFDWPAYLLDGELERQRILASTWRQVKLTRWIL